MILYDFKCESCEGTSEGFANMNDITKTIECQCGGKARRIISPVRCNLEAISGDFPGAYSKWERTRKQHMAIEAKRDAE